MAFLGEAVTAARFRRLHIWLCPCMVFKCVNFICKLDVVLYWFTWSDHCLMWLSDGTFSVAFCAAVWAWMSTVKEVIFLCNLRAYKLVCTMSFLRVFPWYSLRFITWFAYQFCSLFKGRFWCLFNVNLWVKFLLFRRLLCSFQWTASTIIRVRNKLAFQ